MEKMHKRGMKQSSLQVPHLPPTKPKDSPLNWVNPAIVDPVF